MTTITEIKNLTDEELRVRVAELDGWRYVNHGKLTRTRWWLTSPSDCAQYKPEYVHDKPGEDRFGIAGGKLPDYPHDLNAVHEVEEAMTKKQLQNYGLWLAQNVGLSAPNPKGTYLFHATARQRCEALVLTLSEK